jgi:hypothetical protein
MATLMRDFIITEIAAGNECTKEDLTNYVNSEGLVAQSSTIGGTLTFTKQTIERIKALKHWRN